MLKIFINFVHLWGCLLFERRDKETIHQKQFR
jgi:hypothetical protein